MVMAIFDFLYLFQVLGETNAKWHRTGLALGLNMFFGLGWPQWKWTGRSLNTRYSVSPVHKRPVGMPNPFIGLNKPMLFSFHNFLFIDPAGATILVFESCICLNQEQCFYQFTMWVIPQKAKTWFSGCVFIVSNVFVWYSLMAQCFLTFSFHSFWAWDTCYSTSAVTPQSNSFSGMIYMLFKFQPQQWVHKAIHFQFGHDIHAIQLQQWVHKAIHFQSGHDIHAIQPSNHQSVQCWIHCIYGNNYDLFKRLN